jgi:hypothetical protein
VPDVADVPDVPAAADVVGVALGLGADGDGLLPPVPAEDCGWVPVELTA